MRSNKRFWWGKIVCFIPLILAAVAAVSYVVMSLWNGVLTEVIPGLKTVTFWQAAGILVLCKILFGGFKKGRGWGRHHDHRWGNEVREKWQHMTTEEKEQFKQEWRNKCRMWGRGWQNKQQDTTNGGGAE